MVESSKLGKKVGLELLEGVEKCFLPVSNYFMLPKCTFFPTPTSLKLPKRPLYKPSFFLSLSWLVPISMMNHRDSK